MSENKKSKKEQELSPAAFILTGLVLLVVATIVGGPVIRDLRANMTEETEITDTVDTDMNTDTVTNDTDIDEPVTFEDPMDYPDGYKRTGSDYHGSDTAPVIDDKRPSVAYQHVYADYCPIYTSAGQKACDVWVPAGFTADNSNYKDLLIKPSDLDITVESSEPIHVTWLVDPLFNYYDMLKTTEHIDRWAMDESVAKRYESYDYYLTDTYECKISANYDNDDTTKVRIVKSVYSGNDASDLELSDGTDYFIITGLQDTRGRYLGIRIRSEQYMTYLSGRFPDIGTLARGIFRENEQ